MSAGDGLRIGVDVGGTKIEAVAVDAAGSLTATTRGTTPRRPGILVGTILDLIDQVVDAAGRAPITSVGLGIPGIVDVATGRVRFAVNLGIESADIAPHIEERLSVPVRIANDVKAATLGAARHRGDLSSMAYLNLGTGVSAGFVFGGELWQGSQGAAGEIGHISVDPQGRRCSCGQRGCIETLCGGGPVAAAWGRPGEFPVRDVFDAAERGDPLARSLRDDLAHAAAAAVRLLVLTTDVELVVIGGGIAALGDRLQNDIRAVLAREAASSPFLASLQLPRRVELLAASVPVAAVGAALIGAGMHGKVFTTPEVVRG